jgi:hypothetical protein
MITNNPDPGDNWCNLTEDDLLTELRRGLERAIELEQELASAHSHAWLAEQRLQELHRTVTA